MAGRRERLLYAAGALVLGVAFSFAMSRWQMPYAYSWADRNRGWLLATIPFAGLAVLVVTGMRRSAAAIGFVVLAAITAVDLTASAHSWAGYDTPSAARWFQILCGVIVLAHLAGHERGEAKAPRRAMPKTAAALGIGLVAFTVFVALGIVRAWDTDSRHALEIGVALVGPFWLSTVAALYRMARGTARWRAGAYLWFVATFYGLNVLWLIAGTSTLRIE